MKKTCHIDLLPELIIALLYMLAAAATMLSDPPTVVIALAFAILAVSLASWLLADNVVDISTLDDNQILLITRQGRWIPVEVTTLYYSGLGQVLVFHSRRQDLPWWGKRQCYRLADFLPGDQKQAALREQRCLCQPRLSVPMPKLRFQCGELAGDNTVSSASGNRSGTSMLK